MFLEVFMSNKKEFYNVIDQVGKTAPMSEVSATPVKSEAEYKTKLIKFPVEWERFLKEEYGNSTSISAYINLAFKKQLRSDGLL